MRICLIGSSRFPVREPFAGGLEAHTATLARRLADRGHEVTVFAAPGSDPKIVGRTLDVPAFVPSGAARRDVGALPEQWIAEHHAYLSLMLDLAGPGGARFDVVHNNSLHHLPVAMAPAVSMPVVTTLHTPPLAWLESAVRLAGPTASFVAVSRHTARTWRPVVDATVVRNGVDVDRWRPGPGGDRLVWTGRLVPEKAPHLAILAARRAGRPIDLAGPVHDTDYLRREVEPLLGDDARYVGHLDTDRLVELVGRSAALVATPEWDEPYGLVAAEAMSCGTPVAAFARGALPEVVDTASGVLAPSGDVDALARAIAAAVALDRAAVRASAVRRHDLDAMVTGYERCYAAALAATPTAA